MSATLPIVGKKSFHNPVRVAGGGRNRKDILLLGAGLSQERPDWIMLISNVEGVSFDNLNERQIVKIAKGELKNSCLIKNSNLCLCLIQALFI